MTTCRPGTEQCCKELGFAPGHRTLDELLKRFLQGYGIADEDEAWWTEEGVTIENAIRRAFFRKPGRSGHPMRHPHQWIYKRSELKRLAEKLVVRKDEVISEGDFDDLYAVVESAIAEKGKKKLLVYDVALRLGLRFGKHPASVYVQRGAEVGARNLGLVKHGRPRRTIPKSEFGPGFDRLTSAQVEAFLCIFSDEMHPGLLDQSWYR